MKALPHKCNIHHTFESILYVITIMLKMHNWISEYLQG